MIENIYISYIIFIPFVRYQLLFGQNDLSKPVNSQDETLRTIDQAIVHDQFDRPYGSRYYDIAILRFRRLKFSRSVGKICMLQEPITDWRSAIVLGWGATFTNNLPQTHLHQVDLTIFNER